MTLTAKEILDLNRMNEASARITSGGLGTYIAALEERIADLEDSTGGNLRSFSETVAFDDFTDGGAAVGTYLITAGTIPAGATFLVSQVENVVGFAGDTSAVLTIGNASGDVDRYNTSTINVFSTAATGVAAGAPSGTTYHTAEGAITLFVTSATDFTAVNAGSLTVRFYYLV